MMLDDRLDQLYHLLDNCPRVLATFVFDSQADGYATPRSDVDLAILFDGQIPLDEQLALQVKIEEILSRDVDLISINEAPLLLRHRALKGRLIFERDPIAISNLIEDTLRRYRHFAPRLREGRAAYFKSLEQDYGTCSRAATEHG